LETPEAIVINGGEPEVVVRLAKRVRVTLGGAVTDVDGRPIANARVQVIRQEGKFGMGMGRPELTDRQGRSNSARGKRIRVAWANLFARVLLIRRCASEHVFVALETVC
jgi:hypothetical protein